MSARHRPTMLIVDDDPSSSGLLREVFQHEGYDVAVTDRGEAALLLASTRPFDIVLSDVRMPDLDGIEVLRRLRSILPDAAVILISGFATVETAMRALQEGAFDFVQKPFSVEEVRQTVDRAMEQKRRRGVDSSTSFAPGPAGTASPTPPEARSPIVGRSPAMVELIKVVARVADSKSGVLIVGERGTGKDVIARAVHEGSPRAGRPFVTVDVGGLPETHLESELFGQEQSSSSESHQHVAGALIRAYQGSVFLDRIDRLPLMTQTRLSRALDEQSVRAIGSTAMVPIDVRTIAATDEDLEALVREGSFLQDLHRQLAVVTLRVPPLRERTEDIPLLAEHFLGKFSTLADRPVLGFSDRAVAALVAYSWPGNVRELESVVERAVAVAPGPTVGERDLPDTILVQAHTGQPERPAAPRLTLEDTIRTYVLQVLGESGGNKTLAARTLGVPRRTLYRMLERYATDRHRGKSRRPRGKTAPSG